MPATYCCAIVGGVDSLTQQCQVTREDHLQVPTGLTEVMGRDEKSVLTFIYGDALAI
jgi:hypothetical protein